MKVIENVLQINYYQITLYKNYFQSKNYIAKKNYKRSLFHRKLFNNFN